jgi:hypothetical protein
MHSAPLVTAAPPPAGASPWWRHGMVWLVISGPVLAVVAGLTAAAFAVHGADPVIVETPAAPRAAVGAMHTTPTAPAVLARNHAASPR